MPVQCVIEFPQFDTDEMRSIDYRVMKEAFGAHNKIGCLANESVYQRELLRRLRLNGIVAEIEVPVTLSFQTFSILLKLDLVVQRKVVYELKTVSELNKRHRAQLLDYLYLSNTGHGKLINFRPRSVQSEFINSTLHHWERRRFDFHDSDFNGPAELRSLTHELIGDWGTGLNASLYRRAIIHCQTGDVERERMLPMTSSGESVGNQRFHLLDSDTTLAVTTYKDCKPENKKDFEKLLAFSPLKHLHWVNIAHHEVRLTTVRNH